MLDIAMNPWADPCVAVAMKAHLEKEAEELRLTMEQAKDGEKLKFMERLENLDMDELIMGWQCKSDRKSVV